MSSDSNTAESGQLDFIHQPHDKLFKTCFTDLESAISFFKNHLDKRIVEAVDWTSLRRLEGNFIDEHLKATEMDLLYMVTIAGRTKYLYILFEHQSTQDPRVAFRLLKYMVRIWDHFIAENPPPAKLPPILPFVLAQNNKPWTISRQFIDLVDLEDNLALRHNIPDFAYELLDLKTLSYEGILGTPMLQSFLRALKAAAENTLLNDYVWDEALLAKLPPGALIRVLMYIYAVGDIDKKTMLAKINSLKDPSIKENTMTLAQQFKQEGFEEARLQGLTLAQQFKQEGIEEGWQKGRQEGWKDGLIMAIHNFEQILGQKTTAKDILIAMPIADLEERGNQLKAAVNQLLGK
ncbi:MAG: Rpn family recombination-promoting nuclease/putative transposase [Verrucomicrobiota bacterium]|nr:Rpn family recombination-promoting nuclease/putative transposase [Verrucomicrobiota bacterium]